MSKSNEYFMLRRAARHLVVGLWTSDHLWSQPQRILEVYEAVLFLRAIASTFPDKVKTRRGWPYMYEW